MHGMLGELEAILLDGVNTLGTSLRYGSFRLGGGWVGLALIVAVGSYACARRKIRYGCGVALFLLVVSYLPGWKLVLFDRPDAVFSSTLIPARLAAIRAGYLENFWKQSAAFSTAHCLNLHFAESCQAYGAIVRSERRGIEPFRACQGYEKKFTTVYLSGCEMHDGKFVVEVQGVPNQSRLGAAPRRNPRLGLARHPGQFGSCDAS
jgi:hypothetical protein